MARIRSIKPEFFRHEGLQDLEQSNPGSYAMLVFAGLWGHCDRAGRFEWRPRQLKLDILPFLSFDMAVTLQLLESHGLVCRYTVDGRDYGFIPTFTEHQRITGKEALEPCKYPEPVGETTGKQQGNNWDHPVAQEGKGREGEQEREGKGTDAPTGAARAPEPPVVGSTGAAPAWNRRSQRPAALVGSALTHAKCYPSAACERGLCVPAFLGQQWQAQVGGDMARVSAFIAAALAGVSGPVGDDPLKWWRAQWQSAHGTAVPANAKPTTGQRANQVYDDVLAMHGVRAAGEVLPDGREAPRGFRRIGGGA